MLMIGALLINLWLTSISYSAFTTVDVNRFAYRFIFTICMVASMQILIYLYSCYTGESQMTHTRSMTFFVQEILMFAMLIYPLGSRRKELFIRTAFYFIILISVSYWHWTLDGAKLAILIYLATQSKYPVFRKWITISMCVFVLSYVAFYLTYDMNGTLFILSGVLYTITFAYAVNKLYKEDKVDRKIIEKIVKNS